MRDIRFRSTVQILELTDLYREKYKGNESRIEYAMNQQQSISFDVRIFLPSLIANDEETNKLIEQQLNRLCREAMYACANVASDQMGKLK